MNIKKPRGIEDIYYEKANELRALELLLSNIINKYNYHEIRIPIFEKKDLFVHSIGINTDIVNKEMFELIDKKKRIFVLRPEGTTSVIRSVIENKLYNKYQLPLKLFYFGNMFRYERPQYGRLRQFNQFGIEVIGIKNYLLDIEVILLGFNLLKIIGLTNLTLKINYLTVNHNKHIKYITVLSEFFYKKNWCYNCQIRIKKNPLRILECKIDYNKFSDAPKIYNYLTDKEKEEFLNLQNFLTKLNIPFILDFQLVRGIDYYTGVVFEIIVYQKKRELTLLGGGRYDKLINNIKPNLNYPAIGFAIGLERILLILSEHNISLANKNYLDIYLICLSDYAWYYSYSILLLLRSNGFSVDCDYLKRNIKYQFKISEKLKVKNIIIIGNEELKKNIIKIKNQKTRKEQKIKFENIIKFLKREKK